MIYSLPKSLVVGGTEREIRSDFRPCLDIMTVYEDKELTGLEMSLAALQILFVEEITPSDEALQKAMWFLNGGEDVPEDSEKPRLYSWAQDGKYIFSGVDKALGASSRRLEYLHWWEFLAAFYEVGECVFSNIVRLRDARRRGQLTKEERRYWGENRHLLELHDKEADREAKEMEAFLRSL